MESAIQRKHSDAVWSFQHALGKEVRHEDWKRQNFPDRISDLDFFRRSSHCSTVRQHHKLECGGMVSGTRKTLTVILIFPFRTCYEQDESDERGTFEPGLTHQRKIRHGLNIRSLRALSRKSAPDHRSDFSHMAFAFSASVLIRHGTEQAFLEKCVVNSLKWFGEGGRKLFRTDVSTHILPPRIALPGKSSVIFFSSEEQTIQLNDYTERICSRGRTWTQIHSEIPLQSISPRSPFAVIIQVLLYSTRKFPGFNGSAYSSFVVFQPA